MKIIKLNDNLYEGTFEYDNTEYGIRGESMKEVQKCLSESLEIIKKIGSKEYDKIK